MSRSDVLTLVAIAAVLACVLVSKLPGEALVTLLVGVGLKSPLATKS